jgi:hypothetical protein
MWNTTKFDKNPRLKTLVLSDNHDYLFLTPVMVQEFGNVSFIHSVSL